MPVIAAPRLRAIGEALLVAARRACRRGRHLGQAGDVGAGLWVGARVEPGLNCFSAGLSVWSRFSGAIGASPDLGISTGAVTP